MSRLSSAAMLACAALAAGCSTLPASGPTAAEIRRGARTDPMGFRIVDIDPAVVSQINAEVAPPRPGMATLSRTVRTDVVGPGDVLLISVFEVGASLFSSASTSAIVTGGADPGARNATFPAVTVDRAGTITLPFIGTLAVAGRTTTEIQHMIERGLAGKSQNPQVLVALRDNIANRIFVGGDIRKPGPITLTLGAERITDAIALGGGPAYTSDDMLVRLHRGGRVIDEWLSDLTPGGIDDVLLIPGDRLEVLHRPRTFTVFGATRSVSQVPFGDSSVSLAEAVARVGGPTDAQADPRAVFLFRYDSYVTATGPVTTPVIYRLDMMKPASYFLAQKLAMRDKDVLFIGNAASLQPSKLVATLSQLFAPAFTAYAVTRN